MRNGYTFYKCDYKKNVNCKKCNCRALGNGSCFTTEKVECAKVDKNGEPLYDLTKGEGLFEC